MGVAIFSKGQVGLAGDDCGNVSALSILAAKFELSENQIASSPLSASTWNSWELSPPIEPESASTGRYSNPRRSKILQYV